MDRRTLLIIAGGVLLVGGYVYYKRKQASTINNNSNSPVVDPNAPLSIGQQNTLAQGITDSNGNLLPQFSWPYNQLALPYNYNNPPTLNSYTNAQSSDFVGYNSTPAAIFA